MIQKYTGYNSEIYNKINNGGIIVTVAKYHNKRALYECRTRAISPSTGIHNRNAVNSLRLKQNNV